MGIIFSSIILATLIIVADFYIPGNFLNDFCKNGFIETFATLVGFNFASIIFLIGQLMSIENIPGKSYDFSKTKKEIKENSYFLFALFIVSIIFLIVRPDINKDTSSVINNKWYYINTFFLLNFFTLGLFAIFEIVQAIFNINSSSKKKQDSSSN